MENFALDYFHDNYELEARIDGMEAKWQSTYDTYLEECKLEQEEPMEFSEFWREQEANI